MFGRHCSTRPVLISRASMVYENLNQTCFFLHFRVIMTIARINTIVTSTIIAQNLILSDGGDTEHDMDVWGVLASSIKARSGEVDLK